MGTPLLMGAGKFFTFDLDAQAYLIATGIPNDGTVYYSGTFQQRTGAQLWTIVNNTFLELKARGTINTTINFYTKLKALHLFIGGTASAHKWNAINPVDSDAAFRLVFSGGWVHSGTGAKPNGSTGYANTFLSPAGSFGASNANFGRYNGTGEVGGVELGAAGWTCFSNYVTGFTYNNVTGFAINNPDTIGLGQYATNRNSGTTTNGFTNGIQTNSGSESPVMSSTTFYYGGLNNGGLTFPSAKEIRCGHFMDGLTNAEALVFYNIIQSMQIALGRAYQQGVFFGDSVTQGAGATTPALNWVSLVCAAKGWTQLNNGLSGTTLQNAVPVNAISAPNMYDRVAEIPTYQVYKHPILCIAYGINDCGLNFATYSTANFTTQLTAVINYAVSTKGWPLSKIVIQTASFVDPTQWGFYMAYGVVTPADTTRFLAFQTAAQNVAASLGVIFCNPYQAMVDGGGMILMYDARHPNDAGHLVIKNHIVPLITSL